MPGLACGLPLLAAAIAIPAANAAQEASEVEVVDGRAASGERMTVPVRLGGAQSYQFLIDTGAQRTALSTDIAARLKLPPNERRRLISMTGEQTIDTTVLDELALGSRSFYGLRVLLLDPQHIGADGIVGVDSLQNQRVLLDFSRNRMAVGDTKTLGGNAGFEIVVTARRRSGQLIITRADIDGVPTRLVVDTGSDTSVGNRALQRALGRRKPLAGATLTGVTGHEAAAELGYARRLTVGGASLSNVVIAFADSPAFPALDLGTKPALLLGMRELRLFRRVAIDFAARKVMFDLPQAP